jgi:hypothetical protein
VDGVAAELSAGLQQLRDLAHRLHPGLLDAEGLGPALQARLRRSGSRAVLVTSEGAQGHRFDRALEAVVCGCVADAAGTLAQLQTCELDMDGCHRLQLTLTSPQITRIPVSWRTNTTAIWM